jgi:hypothetical protein
MARAPSERETKEGAAAAAAAEQQGPRVRWHTADVKSSYCNVANATTTREEVVINFGVNQNWDRQQAEFDIQLLHRIILSPFAAKRLEQLLSKLITEYEARYGELK